MDEIEIPSHFLCPISLQLMRDPVTVSTGITFDRENIERWLYSCMNKTCPVTKQVMCVNGDDRDLTPNHMLRRLIQSWCSSNNMERIPTPKPPVDKTQIAKLINVAKNSPGSMLKCLKRLASIAIESERNRLSLEASGAIEFLVSVLKNNAVDNNNIVGSDLVSASEETLTVLYHMKISDSQLKNLVNCGHGESRLINSFIQILKHGNYQSRAYSIMLLKSAYHVADPIQLINMKAEIFVEAVGVLHDKISHQATKAALKLLVEATPWGRNRIKAIEANAVSSLINLLLDASEKRECELALTVLDQLCGCADGRAELLKHGAGLAVVSKKILRISHFASDRAVRVLCSVCRYSVTGRVLQEMLEVGVVAKLCLVLQVECGLKCKEKAKEILRLHSRVWRNSSCIPPHLLSSYLSSS